MLHGTLDPTAPLPEGSPETSADYGYGCLVCGTALPVARRGPLPVYCRRCARRLQNLRARSGSVLAADPRSPVPRQRLAGRAAILRTALRNARAELDEVERQLADLDRLARDLARDAEEQRRRQLYGHLQDSTTDPSIGGENA